MLKKYDDNFDMQFGSYNNQIFWPSNLKSSLYKSLDFIVIKDYLNLRYELKNNLEGAKAL